MSTGERGSPACGAAGGRPCGSARAVVGGAVVLALLASTVGMADALVFRKKNLTIAAPPTDPAATPAAPGGEAAVPPTAPTPGATGGTKPANPGAPITPTPATPKPPLDANMIDLARTVELFERMISVGDVRFVDARYPEEFAGGRIPSAVCLPPTKFAGSIPPEVDLLSRDATIVIYCGGGDCDASKLTALRLNELGFMQTLIFHDGFPAWVRAGHPVEK